MNTKRRGTYGKSKRKGRSRNPKKKRKKGKSFDRPGGDAVHSAFPRKRKIGAVLSIVGDIS